MDSACARAGSALWALACKFAGSRTDHHGANHRWRLIPLAFNALQRLRPDYELRHDSHYGYAFDCLTTNLINGSEMLRQWVDDPEATSDDLHALTACDVAAGLAKVETVRLYI